MLPTARATTQEILDSCSIVLHLSNLFKVLSLIDWKTVLASCDINQPNRKQYLHNLRRINKSLFRAMRFALFIIELDAAMQLKIEANIVQPLSLDLIREE